MRLSQHILTLNVVYGRLTGGLDPLLQQCSILVAVKLLHIDACHVTLKRSDRWWQCSAWPSFSFLLCLQAVQIKPCRCQAAFFTTLFILPALVTWVLPKKKRRKNKNMSGFLTQTFKKRRTWFMCPAQTPSETILQVNREAWPSEPAVNRSCAASWSWNGSWIETPRIRFSLLSQTLSNCKNSTWFTNNGCVSSPIPSPPVCPSHRSSNYRLQTRAGHWTCTQ